MVGEEKKSDELNEGAYCHGAEIAGGGKTPGCHKRAAGRVHIDRGNLISLECINRDFPTRKDAVASFLVGCPATVMPGIRLAFAYS